MHESEPTGELARMLSLYRASGGVIDYTLFSLEPEEQASIDLHRQAAFSAVRPQSELQAENASCSKITIAEFIGPDFDPETQCFREKSAAENYVYAFTDPPYPLMIPGSVNRLPEADILWFFNDINKFLFDSFQVELVIYAWSADWSDYFDAGDEWWGSFLWTVYNPQQNCIVVVAASTTD